MARWAARRGHQPFTSHLRSTCAEKSSAFSSSDSSSSRGGPVTFPRGLLLFPPSSGVPVVADIFQASFGMMSGGPGGPGVRCVQGSGTPGDAPSASVFYPMNMPQGLRQCCHYAFGTGSGKSYPPTCFKSMLRALGSQGLCGLSVYCMHRTQDSRAQFAVAQVSACTLF